MISRFALEVVGFESQSQRTSASKSQGKEASSLDVVKHMVLAEEYSCSTAEPLT